MGSTNLVINEVDFAHLRLLDLTKIANQAEPFYRWVEKEFQKSLKSTDPLAAIIKESSLEEIQATIYSIYNVQLGGEIPKLYDGGGVAYQHRKACFLFFSWLARDAATQRLTPLISKAAKLSKLKGKRHDRVKLESLVLASLLYEYKDNLRYFEWPVFREVALHRLEGSRRAKKGSEVEIFVRSALSEAFTYYQKTHSDFGEYSDFKIPSTPLKVKHRTYDVVAELERQNGDPRLLVLPVKTRETQGGGHAHLFTRDIEQANLDIQSSFTDPVIASVIIAENWSETEIDEQTVKHGTVFHFDESPNNFAGFDRVSQRKLNELVEKVIDGKL